MDPNDFLSKEGPRWVSGLGFYIMSEYSDDDAGWSENKTYYVNFDIGTELWTLKISTETKQKEEHGIESEESHEETIGPLKLEEFRKILATYHFELDNQMASEIIKTFKKQVSLLKESSIQALLKAPRGWEYSGA